MKSILVSIVAVVLLAGCGGPSVDIHEAAGTGNIEAVKQHLAAGADVNAKFDDGQTPLHNAAQNGQKKVAELLIANGADVNAKDRGGLMPLD
jgi:ankyrin repeat protein